MVFTTGPVVLALFGWMPTDQSVLLPILLVCGFILAVGAVGSNITTMSIVGDIAGEHEVRSGSRREGVFFGSLNFIEKAFDAVGNMLAGFAIDFIRLNPNSKPDEVPAEILTRFGTVYSAFALISFFSLWAFLYYNIDREKHAGIMKELEERKSSEVDRNKGQ